MREGGSLAKDVADLGAKGHFDAFNGFQDVQTQCAIECDQGCGMLKMCVWPIGAQDASQRAAAVIRQSLGLARRVKIPREAVVADLFEQLLGGRLVINDQASALELCNLLPYRHPGLGVLDHASPQKKISPSREASGLIVMTRY